MWDFLNETYSEKLHEGQITFHAASASESPEKVSKNLQPFLFISHCMTGTTCRSSQWTEFPG